MYNKPLSGFSIAWPGVTAFFSKHGKERSDKERLQGSSLGVGKFVAGSKHSAGPGMQGQEAKWRSQRYGVLAWGLGREP